MIQEFTNGVYKYSLSSPTLMISKIKINGIDISKYLNNGSKVGEYDVSKNSGRDITNADGTMVLNVIATKYRLDLMTRPLTEDEVVDFYKEIRKSPKIRVEFLNPFDKQWKTINCYRGDRNIQAMFPIKQKQDNEEILIEIYSSISQALIEL